MSVLLTGKEPCRFAGFMLSHKDPNLSGEELPSLVILSTASGSLFLVLRESDAGFRRILSGYKARAKKRGWAWELTDEQAEILLCSACWYCGCGPKRTYNRAGPTTDTGYPGLFQANGIDRIDSSGPYSTDNTRPACWQCNRMKGVLDEYTFTSHVRDMFQHMTAKGIL